MGFHLIEKYVKPSWVNLDFRPGHIPCGLCRAIKTKSWLNITRGFIPKRDTMAHIQLDFFKSHLLFWLKNFISQTIAIALFGYYDYDAPIHRKTVHPLL